MTVLIGVLCSDGVVIGSDSSATFSAGTLRTIEQPTKKINIIRNKSILACTGSVGFSQRAHLVISERDYRYDKKMKPENLAVDISKQCKNNFITKINNYDANLRQHTGLGIGALYAVYLDSGPCLMEFDVQQFQPELKNSDLWYVSMGSGQTIADPFLGFIRKVFWKNEQPTLSEGVIFVSWALQLTIDINPGGVGGNLQIATLSEQNGQWIAQDKTTEELKEYVAQFEDAICGCWGKFKQGLYCPVPDHELPTP